MDARLDRTVTSGRVTLEGRTVGVKSNVYVIGDRFTCVLIDAPHNIDLIMQLIGDRILQGIICTHAHEDHIRLAPMISMQTGAPILLHASDLPLWKEVHPDAAPHGMLRDDQEIEIGRTTLKVLHTPGHTPGSVSFWWPDSRTVFTGDTLPIDDSEATNERWTDHDQLRRSIDERLLCLGDDVIVRPGHGPETTLGVERERRRPE